MIFQLEHGFHGKSVHKAIDEYTGISHGWETFYFLTSTTTTTNEFLSLSLSLSGRRGVKKIFQNWTSNFKLPLSLSRFGKENETKIQGFYSCNRFTLFPPGCLHIICTRRNFDPLISKMSYANDHQAHSRGFLLIFDSKLMEKNVTLSKH